MRKSCQKLESLPLSAGKRILPPDHLIGNGQRRLEHPNMIISGEDISPVIRRKTSEDLRAQDGLSAPSYSTGIRLNEP